MQQHDYNGERFSHLQAKLAHQYKTIFTSPQAQRCVVVVPSLSLEIEELNKISGVNHYEERMLCLLMLLRLPRTKLIYLSSQIIDPTIIDYYLHLLTGVPTQHARNRLCLLNCQDASSRPLSEKIIERPRLLNRIKQEIGDPSSAHMTCFNVTTVEANLAIHLGIPIYGCDPSLTHLGSKSGSRKAFKASNVKLPPGHEDIHSEEEVCQALQALRQTNPNLKRAVVKLNEGFSGEGNATFTFPKESGFIELNCIRNKLATDLRFEAPKENLNSFLTKITSMGGIVEEFIEGEEKRSPSVQCRIDPLGGVEVISTHDQVLGGPTGQVFVGCQFPADSAYRLAIQKDAQTIARHLRDQGVIGRFAIDFITVNTPKGWNNYAVEINLRKGGTTHPFLMLHFLVDGTYDQEQGLYKCARGKPHYYFASDNLIKDQYRGLCPTDLIDISVYNGLHFHSAILEGVVFHLIGALSEFGKLGILCIGDSPEQALNYHAKAASILDMETDTCRFSPTYRLAQNER